ncbi:iron ABC transporter permease [Sphingomonas sp.]|uniref:FecCD family ABC transporter permease n=1 Tax=Sphingomonas sp. TaxID=28214 RepID=UPI00286A912A|nr:iron ABC transporter permease [Sphingomonas sp.]
MKNAPFLLVLLAALLALHLLLPASLLSLDSALRTLLLVELRLPRTLLVAGYGAVLGLTGAALQALFGNPLASPDVTGSSSGAALGAVLGGYWLGLTEPLALAACGVAGSITALAALLLMAGRKSDTAMLLLAGIGISLACGAATSLALALAPSPFAFYDAFDWLMGNFTDRSLGQAGAALIPATIAAILLTRRARALDLLALGEDVAASLGFRPQRLGIEVVALSAVAVGACVAVCGAVGFIGLIAPFLARRLTRGHPGRAMIPAALIGALLLLIADLVTRGLDRTIPIGVITALAGTPLFLWLIVHQRRGLTP